MSTKTIKTRIQHKHDTEENWNKATFTSLVGEFYIYDPDATHKLPRVKVGDGQKAVKDLPFTTPITAGTADPSASVSGDFYFKYSD